MKKILNLTLTTCIALAIVGCGSTNTTKESASTEQASTTVESTAAQSKSENTADAKETTYPVTVTTYDADGKEISQVFEKAPERVITNNLSSTEMLIDLGLQDKIVGMLNPDNEVSSDYAAAISSIPHIGDKKSVSKAVVLSNGVPVYTQKASVSNMKQSLESVIDDVKNIGIIFNIQDKANAYADELQKRIDAVTTANKANAGELKNALIMCAYNDQTFGAYKSALQESILNTLGYTNVATGTSDLTLENLVTMSPEVIIYVTSDRNKELDTKAVDLMKANAVISEVPAIKNDKIMTISYDELMDYGTSSINALEDINSFLNK